MISVEFVGLDKTIERLTAMARRLRDLRPAWRSVLSYLKRATEQTFVSQGARIGTQWAPLSEGYAKQKAVVYPGQPILRASDAMFNSLVGGNSDSVVEIQEQELTYGTRTKYARYHQDGTPRMSQRRILAVTDDDRREIKQIVRRHLENQAQLGGFE